MRQEESVINSELRWEQVRLPAPLTEADIDAIIFSVMKTRWQKVAMIVGDGVGQCKERRLPINGEMIAARLRALADSNLIEAQGDLRKWRFSEARLKT
jgi:hypothetical protein